MNYNKRKEVINQVSWSDLFSQDSYYWLQNSFQYSENINADDEMHGIKLAQKVRSYGRNELKDCQLVEAWDWVRAFPIKNWWKIYKFNKDSWNDIDDMKEISWVNVPAPHTHWSYTTEVGRWCIFQEYFWLNVNLGVSSQSVTWFFRINLSNTNPTWEVYIPYDHKEDTDESISDENTKTDMMSNAVTYVLNFNNSRLIVACWNELRCYYPELDKSNPGSPIYSQYAQPGHTWWKKVQTFWWWHYILALTCTFEYLKVRVQDHWYNTKVFYYQANNDFRSTFVYNQIDLKNTKVGRVYSINGIDYYTTILDWGWTDETQNDWLIALNKLLGSTPVQIFTRKWWLVSEDIFSKAWYFIGPTALDACYLDGNIYMADVHWVFKFKYNPSWKDPWYLKWKIHDWKVLPTWLAICQNYIYLSDASWLHQMRLYDTWEDDYQEEWILISREFEWNKFQWCFTKFLDEIRLNYELNPEISNANNGYIDVYVSPNNTWTDTNPSWTWTDWWFKVMRIEWDMKKTRTQISHLLNNYETNIGETSFEFDRQTITYAIKIHVWNDTKATPIVREVQLWYHTKGKTNQIYDIK
jgi:hypothetical protein